MARFMPSPARPLHFQLVVACQGAAARAATAQAADAVIEKINAARLACTVAVDAAMVRQPRASQCEWAVVMPLESESDSLESRMAACRAAGRSVDAVYLPAGATLRGALADLSRLDVRTVIDASDRRTALPVSVVRQAVDTVAPGDKWWRRLSTVNVDRLVAEHSRGATVVIEAAQLARAGGMGRRQISRLIESLQSLQACGEIRTATASDLAAALTAGRRPIPQQSILRAA